MLAALDTSPENSSAGMSAMRLPWLLTVDMAPMWVCCHLTSSRMPIFLRTLMRASPRKSAEWPPPRSEVR
ncbi:hypothetical protein ACWEPC_55355 [Nonomuraea sp. NPDC004297]